MPTLMQSKSIKPSLIDLDEDIANFFQFKKKKESFHFLHINNSTHFPLNNLSLIFLSSQTPDAHRHLQRACSMCACGTRRQPSRAQWGGQKSPMLRSRLAVPKCSNIFMLGSSSRRQWHRLIWIFFSGLVNQEVNNKKKYFSWTVLMLLLPSSFLSSSSAPPWVQASDRWAGEKILFSLCCGQKGADNPVVLQRLGSTGFSSSGSWPAVHLSVK